MTLRPQTASARIIDIHAGAVAHRWPDDWADLPLQPMLPLGPAPEVATGADDTVGEDVRRAVVWLATAMLETIAGRRPAHQLSRWLSDDAMGSVLDQRRILSGASDTRLVAVRIQCPNPGVAEVSLRLARDGHFMAAAIRVVACTDRWRCEAAEFGPAPRLRAS